MKKSDIISVLSENESLRGKEAAEIVDLVFDGFTNALRRGERIEIRGFGSFSVREYPPYLGKNPKTGRRVQVGSKKLPYFKVGRELKALVNGGRKGQS